jgi:DNA modification methylase
MEIKCINQYHQEGVSIYHGDSCEMIRALPDNSIHYSIFSPPFANLYTYSNSIRDMGNCKGDNEFYEHFKFLVTELFRVIKPGRLVSIHCMNLPTSKEKDGFIGIRDFRGELIYLFQQAGFIYHSEVVIWKDPVMAMQRTKALGLLHKQLQKDSAMSRQGIPDYLVTMRKPGENPEPVTGKLDDFVGDRTMGKTGDATRDSINIWQQYASPVWMDINPSDTLQFRSARDNDNERHIAPLQLQVIERGLQLWTNPGDVVLDPFNGIASTGHICIKRKRKYIGFELKESYFNASINNLKTADIEFNQQLTLFDGLGM